MRRPSAIEVPIAFRPKLARKSGQSAGECNLAHSVVQALASRGRGAAPDYGAASARALGEW